MEHSEREQDLATLWLLLEAQHADGEGPSQLDLIGAGYDAGQARAAARIEGLDVRRREGRQLLRRFVKYAREDRAVTPGLTRLERLTAQVDDYLRRTEDPNDILRAKD